MEVLLFGIAKDIVGESTLRFREGVLQPESVLELKQKLKDDYPELARLTSLAVAVNSEYAEDNRSLNIGDEIAIIPPVSGG